jgi:hypothetical protein
MRGLSKSILFVIALLFSGSVANAQVSDWCLRWTDDCSICSRTSIDADPTCTEPRRRCVARPISCLAADQQEAKRNCDSVVVDLNYCNACSRKPNGTFMCTLKGCVPRILCVRPRQT